jgi:N-acetylneuraminate synthase
MIEFHFDLDGRGDEYVLGHCWLPGDIAWVIQNAQRAFPSDLRRSHPADGDGKKEPRPAERAEREWRTDPADGLRPLQATRARLLRQAVG